MHTTDGVLKDRGASFTFSLGPWVTICNLAPTNPPGTCSIRENWLHSCTSGVVCYDNITQAILTNTYHLYIFSNFLLHTFLDVLCSVNLISPILYLIFYDVGDLLFLKYYFSFLWIWSKHGGRYCFSTNSLMQSQCIVDILMMVSS